MANTSAIWQQSAYTIYHHLLVAHQPHTYNLGKLASHTHMHTLTQTCTHTCTHSHKHAHTHAHASKPHSNPTKQAKRLNQKNTPFQLGGKPKPTEALTAK